jgi:hypothetical protein
MAVAEAPQPLVSSREDRLTASALGPLTSRLERLTYLADPPQRGRRRPVPKVGVSKLGSQMSIQRGSWHKEPPSPRIIRGNGHQA